MSTNAKNLGIADGFSYENLFFSQVQILQRLQLSVACWQQQRANWSLWTALSTITAPPDLHPCTGSGRQETNWTSLSLWRYRPFLQSPTGPCYWPLYPSLCHTKWNPGSDVKPVTQEPVHWPHLRSCMWHVSTFEYIFVIWLSSCAKINFNLLSSFAQRCGGSGPVPDSEGRGQCLVGLHM